MVQELKSLALYEDIVEILNKDDFDLYWKGFKKSPFALYNSTTVVLCNHPNPPKDFSPLREAYIGSWNDSFVGNTAINLNGHYTAILNMDTLYSLDSSSSLNKVYSILVHEMFHCHQLSHNENRWADEMLFINYNFSQSSISLRLMDKDYLLCALDDQNKYTRDKLLTDFIQRRERRKNIVGSMLNYELALESIEGTATYVEVKALAHRKNIDVMDVAEDFLHNFDFEDLNKYRASCYAFGLVICLILDSIAPNWHEEFTNSDTYLYKFFKAKFGSFNELTDFSIDNYYVESAKELINKYVDSKKESFENFNKSEGYKVILYGNLKLSGFDPMNVISMDNKVLHKNFIKYNSSCIKDQALSFHKEDFWTVDKIEFFVSDKPKVFDHGILTSKGTFYGEVSEDNNIFCVDLYNEQIESN
ncbi:hypothetical protein SAMN04487885_10898 [Clostridium cadaveris]|uniref:Uncharacterized protein n=2 Tax=Clostridiaceae TaxID=31979 RepID=A0A1I2L378_9CLOT|nr:hypothetical protein [Clostridium cadaveris]SFF73313.1 hypothetical protein SAMN04487885_10898 [Clostridium cadaveris]